MSNSTLYVKYQVAPPPKGMGLPVRRDPPVGSDLSLQEFIQSRNGEVKLIGSFMDTPENRRTFKWPELQKALDHCRQQQATLLILELGNLTSANSFTELLLQSGVPFYCLDQPFITTNILEALSKHAEIQKNLHGKRIREGLKMSNAKSGNPNAAEVIWKVNKPKVDAAIIFALLLKPIAEDYQNKGYSQRQMVKQLNEEGFSAPEGGRWVLSQLQKVLERVKLNEISMQLTPLISALTNPTLTNLVQVLNENQSPALKGVLWDVTQVKKITERIQHLQEITAINQFLLTVLPILHEYRKRGLSPREMLLDFQEAKVPLQKKEILTVPC